MTVNSLAVTTKDALSLDLTWKQHRIQSNSFVFFLLIEAKYAQAASFRVIQVRTTDGINLKQTDTIQKFCQDVIRGMDNCRSDLCGKDDYEDYIHIDKLYQYVFTGGLNLTQFGAKLENFYATNPTVTLTVPLLTLMDEYISYSNQRNISISSCPEATSALITTTSNALNSMKLSYQPPSGRQPNGALLNNDGTKTKCEECSKWFPIKTTTHGSYFKFCKSCNDIRYINSNNKKAGIDIKMPPTINPTPKLPSSVAELKLLLASAEKKELLLKQASFFSALMDDEDDDEATTSL